jgi:hypothetical protein
MCRTVLFVKRDVIGRHVITLLPESLGRPMTSRFTNDTTSVDWLVGKEFHLIYSISTVGNCQDVYKHNTTQSTLHFQQIYVSWVCCGSIVMEIGIENPNFWRNIIMQILKQHIQPVLFLTTFSFCKQYYLLAVVNYVYM